MSSRESASVPPHACSIIICHLEFPSTATEPAQHKVSHPGTDIQHSGRRIIAPTPKEFNVANEAEKVLQWLRQRTKAWPDGDRPELAKALRKFAGEIMAGGEIPQVEETQ